MALSGVVDTEALAACRLATQPFAWGHLPQAIAPDAAAALRDTFPRDGYWELRGAHHGSPMTFALRPLVVLGEPAMVAGGPEEPIWRQLVEDLLSPAYRHASARASGLDLAGALLEVTAWRWQPSAELGPHPDMPRKLVTEVFYFNEGWDPAWGGCLRILGSRDPRDCVAELPPELGSASIIVRSDDSWHAVSPVVDAAAQARLSVVATWQHAGSESPFWTVRDSGEPACHARDARYIGAA